MYIAPKKSSRWEPLLFKPECPSDWKVEERINSLNHSITTFVKWGKPHHNANPEKIYVVFCEFPPKNKSYQYTVRGGLYAKPTEDLKYFKDIKSAKDYVIYLMESTDRWLNEINSPKYIIDYNERIKRAVREEERRQEYIKSVME